MTQEYRKASAEKLGFKEYNNPLLGMVYRKGDYLCKISDWKPDKKENADQREMIEDWLIEQGCGLELEYCTTDKTWLYHIIMKGHYVFQGEDKSKSTAFMKAFMEYNKVERRKKADTE